jgi:hypothetical protein
LQDRWDAGTLRRQPTGFYPGAAGRNDDLGKGKHTDAKADFAVVSDLRRLVMRSAVEALRGVQTLKHVSAANRRGGYAMHEDQDHERSLGVGDILFELGTAHLRTWQRLLEIAQKHGDSWVTNPSPERPIGLQVVNLTSHDDHTFQGVVRVRNASPIRAPIRCPEEALFRLEAEGEERRALLHFHPDEVILEPYSELDDLTIHVVVGSGLHLEGTWLADIKVTLASVVELDLRLCYVKKPPKPPKVEIL